MEEMYTLNEVAQLLKVSTKSITRYVKIGDLKASKIGGQWRFKPKEIARFVDEKESGKH